MNDFRDSVETVAEAFRSVRHFILGGAGTTNVNHKPDASVVTDFDIEAEHRIRAFINEHFPDLPILGEEGGYDPNDLPETCWLIDPIDGTASYVENIPTFTSMGVLISGDEVVAAVIYDPTTDDMFTAIKGEGAYQNGQRLDLRNKPLPDNFVDRGLFSEELEQLLASKNLRSHKPAYVGAGYGFSRVAVGATAARINLHSGGYIHDYAPGCLLVQEAGGSVIPIIDESYTYRTRTLVACHPELDELIRQIIPRLRELEARP